MKKVIIIIIVVFLLAGVGVQYLGLSRARQNLQAPNVGYLIPKEIPGWVVQDKPIADSPEMMRVVEGILNFDSAVFRVYHKDDLEISIYIAYWLPGKIPVSAVDAHTPDICWVANGWAMERFPALPDRKMADGGVVPIPNYRKFHIASTNSCVSVIYWHLDGDHLREQRSVAERHMTFFERATNRLNHFKNIIFTPPQQQVFIRVSSNKDISREDVLGSAPVEAGIKLVESLMKGAELFQEER